MVNRAGLNQEELEEEEEDMLQYSHKGEWCWLVGQSKVFCQEGWCRECDLYLGWKENSRKERVE